MKNFKPVPFQLIVTSAVLTPGGATARKSLWSWNGTRLPANSFQRPGRHQSFASLFPSVGTALAAAEARAGHVEGLLDDARGRFRQMILAKLVFPRPRHVNHVASRAQLAAGSFAEIVHNHVVVFRALPLASVPGIGGKNPLEDLDHLEHAHREPGLFAKLARATLHKRFAQLERASRNRPLAAQRFAAAADQQRAPVLDHDAADADYRTLRKFPRRRHCVDRSAVTHKVDRFASQITLPPGGPRLRSLLP